MRRATGAISSGLAQRAISIHALHEESDLCSYPSPSAVAISIHALHEESDRVHTTFDSKVLSLFQSTLSMRRATKYRIKARTRKNISIHALHEESDSCGWPCGCWQCISIHALHEESDVFRVVLRGECWLFQSTLSMRRATSVAVSRRLGEVISIHALHEESDDRTCRIHSQNKEDFNPRSP